MDECSCGSPSELPTLPEWGFQNPDQRSRTEANLAVLEVPQLLNFEQELQVQTEVGHDESARYV